jgi:hypothetical protein
MKSLFTRTTVFLASTIFFFEGVNVAFGDNVQGAAGTGGSSITLTNPLGNTTSFNTVLQNVGTFLILVAVPLCGIMVIVGGFQMITAAGKPEQFSTGRKTLIYAAIGFVVVLLATSIVPLLKSILGG